MYSRKNICPQIISIAVAYNALLRTMTIQICLFFLVLPSASGQTWTPDNGNGTFSNPLFYDEFSDPDMIRVGEDYYLTGTTMHTMPGLPVLHSKELVNWKLLGYAFAAIPRQEPRRSVDAHRAQALLHDLSVLFDDDGKVYVVWGYRGIKFAQLNSQLTDVVPGTERSIIAPNPGMERARTSIRSRVNTTSSVHGGTAACACLVRVPTSRRAPMKS
jgi:hypothetical protein